MDIIWLFKKKFIFVILTVLNYIFGSLKEYWPLLKWGLWGIEYSWNWFGVITKCTTNQITKFYISKFCLSLSLAYHFYNLCQNFSQFPRKTLKEIGSLFRLEPFCVRVNARKITEKITEKNYREICFHKINDSSTG